MILRARVYFSVVQGRDEGDLIGDHDGGEQNQEEQVASGKAEAGKAEGNQAGGDQLAEQGECGDEDGVTCGPADAHVPEVYQFYERSQFQWGLGEILGGQRRCGGVVRLQFEALQAQIGEKDRPIWVNSVYFAIEFHEI
ncbi:MAG: hypothetical protein OXG26_21945 [Caldilineaceae bacterium]|nr:hypothetical protein [Caldilineaceae bacterium]